ncbi:MAG: aminotransferase class V-fold PLP-dependent enzyme [Candidatus Muiribacteriaceae bacterium]
MKSKNKIWKDHFPALRKSIYLNTGSEGLIPRDTFYLMQRLIKRNFKYGGSHPDYFAYMNMYYRKLREAFSELGRDIDGMIRVASTSEGMNFSFNMHRWKKGDRVVIRKDEFKTVILAALVARQRFDIEILWADDIKDFIEIIRREKPAAAACSHVDYRSGEILPVEEIYSVCAEHTFFICDGAQAFGNIFWKIPEKIHADMYVFTTHKWGISPRGLGFVIPAGKQDRTAPVSAHYFSTSEWKVPDNMSFTGEISDYSNHFNNFLGEAGFVSSYRFLKKKGFERIETLKKKVKDAFLEGFRESGIEVINRDSQLLSFIPGDHDPDKFVSDMQRHGILLRTIPDTPYVRISPHFYNTESNAEIFFRKMRKLG